MSEPLTDEFLAALDKAGGITALEEELVGEVIRLRRQVMSNAAEGNADEVEIKRLRGELGVWKSEALRRREEMRDAALSVHETIRLTVLDNGRVQVRLPSREVFLSTGQTMVVKSDGTYVTEWEA